MPNKKMVIALLLGGIVIGFTIYTSLDRTIIKKEIASDLSLRLDENDAFLKVGTRHLNQYKPESWLTPSDFSLNQEQLLALQRVGLLKKNPKSNFNKKHQSLLTQMGASRLLTHGKTSGFYFGQLSFAGIESITRLHLDQLMDESVYLVEPKFEVKSQEPWIETPGLKTLFPQLEKVTSAQGKRYLFIKSKHINNADTYKQIVGHVKKEAYKKYERREKFRICYVGPAFQLSWFLDWRFYLYKLDRFIPYSQKRLNDLVKKEATIGKRSDSVQIIHQVTHEYTVFPYTRCRYKAIGRSKKNPDELIFSTYKRDYIHLYRKFTGGNGISNTTTKKTSPEAYQFIEEMHNAPL